MRQIFNDNIVQQDIKEKIQSAGLKATPQRIAIYDIMLNMGHVSADMVIERLRQSYPSLTRATVYNVLESFEKSGLIVKRYSPSNKMFFDINTYDHVHLYDKQESTYRDYPDLSLIELVRDYLKDKQIPGFDVEKVEVQLIGRSVGE